MMGITHISVLTAESFWKIMTKKPRKPKTMFWYASKLWIEKDRIYFCNVLDSKSGYILEPQAAKRLWKWLKQATEYLEKK